QEELATRCGISISFASLLERGERSPSYETLVDVAEALEVPLSELFRDLDAKTYHDPYFDQLVDFARRSRLTREQVDRVISVARAMFDGNGQAAAVKGEPLSERQTCSSQGCGRPVLA